MDIPTPPLGDESPAAEAAESIPVTACTATNCLYNEANKCAAPGGITVGPRANCETYEPIGEEQEALPMDMATGGMGGGGMMTTADIRMPTPQDYPPRRRKVPSPPPL